MNKGFYISLREDIMNLNGLISNSEGVAWYHDNSKRNYSTKWDIMALLFKYQQIADKNGFKTILRHFDCGSMNHPKSDEFPHSDIYGNPVEFKKDKKYYDIFGGYEGMKCPCSKTNGYTMHGFHVYGQIECNDISESDGMCLKKIFEIIYEAKELSGDKRPRAAIREQMLLLILNLNDLILPQTVEKYIESISAKAVANDCEQKSC
jgi:hypothetical protein